MFRRQALIVLAAGACLPSVAHATTDARVGVAVRIYNTAGVPAETRRGALAVAARTLASSRIGVDWLDCGIAETCALPPAADELVVRLVRGPRGGATTAPFVLGEAAIDTSARAGVLASIYVDRVEVMATLSGTDAVSLLGLAIAHELGHLLMASNAHSSRGLMRARWSTRDLRRKDALDWLLTKSDAAVIRQRFKRF